MEKKKEGRILILRRAIASTSHLEMVEGVLMGGLFLFSSSEMESKERGKKCLEMFEVKVEMWRKGVIYSYTYCNPLIHHSCKLHTF